MFSANQITVERIANAFPPKVSGHVAISSLPVSSKDGQWIDPYGEVSRVVAESFSKIPQVAAMYSAFSGDYITIWTLLKSNDRKARESIYAKELEICDRFVVCGFDFKVSSVEAVTPAQLQKDGFRRIFSR